MQVFKYIERVHDGYLFPPLTDLDGQVVIPSIKYSLRADSNPLLHLVRPFFHMLLRCCSDYKQCPVRSRQNASTVCEECVGSNQAPSHIFLSDRTKISSSRTRFVTLSNTFHQDESSQFIDCRTDGLAIAEDFQVSDKSARLVPRMK